MVGLLQRLRQQIAREGRLLARSLQGVLLELQEEWLQLCREVAAGRTEGVHAQRGSFLARLQSRLEQLRHIDELARLDGGALEASEDLSRQLSSLEKLYDKLTRRWQDTEGLEYLAAEALTPSAEKLDAIAARHGFPQGWYDQDDDPFQE